MRPTVSPPISTPSYRPCAIFIVREAEKPSLREASCCSVEVMNGGEGCRLTGFFSISPTVKRPALIVSTAFCGRALRCRATACRASAPFSRMSRAVKFPAAAAEIGFDRPVFLRLERFDLELALADEAQRHRLHAACRARAGQFAPQHRREREADEIVERPARQIGVDQLLVDLAGMRHRVEHGGLGYRVENDALDFGLAERLASGAAPPARARKSPRPRGRGRLRESAGRPT